MFKQGGGKKLPTRGKIFGGKLGGKLTAKIQASKKMLHQLKSGDCKKL